MSTILEYDSIPGVLPIYAKMFVTKKKGFRPGDTFPKITAVVKDVTIDQDKLKAYREICELPEDGYLPVLYPHVFTAPLHMAILSHKEFPIPLAGMLHYRNHSIQHRPIKQDEKLDVEVALDEHRIVKQGFEFDYTIRIVSGGEVVWNSITTYLKQGRFGTEYTPSPRSELIQPEKSAKRFVDHFIPKNIGKRYAKICSDYNPIHISKFMAKLMGFKRDIAHAMWATSLSIGKVGVDPKKGAVRIDLGFKAPLIIESKSYITKADKKEYTRFDYMLEGSEKPCVIGKISYVKKGSKL